MCFLGRAEQRQMFEHAMELLRSLTSSNDGRNALDDIPDLCGQRAQIDRC